jgi:hypothetical protein
LHAVRLIETLSQRRARLRISPVTGQQQNSTPERVNDVAMMHDGILCLQRGAFAEALERFDRVIAIREQWDWLKHPEAAWMLAAAWLNRADALRGLASATCLRDALAALDRALEVMEVLPLAENPALADRPILAWIHRATLCAEADDVEGAVAGFSQADAILETWGRNSSSQRVMLDAMLQSNRAKFSHLGLSGLDRWRDVRHALALLGALPESGETRRARAIAEAICCQVLAQMLDEPKDLAEVEDWIAEATDAAESALAYAQSCERQEAWMADLVRYGARIYRVCQPHFLGEFLCDWLAGDGWFANDGGLKEDARRELLLARMEAERRVRLAPHDTDLVEKQRRLLASLQLADGRIT